MLFGKKILRIICRQSMDNNNELKCLRIRRNKEIREITERILKIIHF